MTGDDPKDKFREARDLFARSRETFYEGRKEGMGAFAQSRDEEQSEQLGDAIETGRRAIEQAGEAIRLQREALDVLGDVTGGDDAHGPSE